MIDTSMLRRRQWLQLATASFIGAGAATSRAVDIPGQEPLLDLHQRLPEPVPIAAVDQLQIGNAIWIRVTSESGQIGFCPGNDRLKVTVEMARKLVIPFFIGKDARDIERLVDNVYTSQDKRGSVYKYAGMPFWNIVGHIEVAIFDLLARIAGTGVNQLLGQPLRQRIPVYISQFGRETSAEEEVARAAADLEKTGAKATKLKIGLRMANSAGQSRRDRKMIELARKTFDDDVTIYVDSNSSYTVDEAIAMGRFLNDHGVALFEEPVPWQDYRGTREVTEALSDLPIQVAGGEQDSSLWQWREMVDRRTVDIVQPDLFYNGGFVRSLRVARMAKSAGMLMTPHSPKAGTDAAAHLHLCSVIPNLGPFQEYRAHGQVDGGVVDVPDGPGLGIDAVSVDFRNATVL